MPNELPNLDCARTGPKFKTNKYYINNKIIIELYIYICIYVVDVINKIIIY